MTIQEVCRAFNERGLSMISEADQRDAEEREAEQIRQSTERVQARELSDLEAHGQFEHFTPRS